MPSTRFKGDHHYCTSPAADLQYRWRGGKKEKEFPEHLYCLQLLRDTCAACHRLKGPWRQHTSFFCSKDLVLYSTLRACPAVNHALFAEKPNTSSWPFNSPAALYVSWRQQWPIQGRYRERKIVLQNMPSILFTQVFVASAWPHPTACSVFEAQHVSCVFCMLHKLSDWIESVLPHCH